MWLSLLKLNGITGILNEMEGLNLNNPEHAKEIQEILKQGSKGQFWDIVCQRLDEYLDNVQKHMENDKMAGLIAEEYKIRMESLKAEKINMTHIKNLPELLANDLDNPEFFKQDIEEEVYDEPEIKD